MKIYVARNIRAALFSKNITLYVQVYKTTFSLSLSATLILVTRRTEWSLKFNYALLMVSKNIKLHDLCGHYTCVQIYKN